MKHVLKIASICCVLLLGILPWAQAQPFNALHFDGDDDAVTLSLAGTPLAGNPSDFSAKVWFQSQETTTNTNCSGNFRRLLSFGGTGSRLELGVCGPDLNLFLQIPGQAIVGPVAFGSIAANSWNHLALVRSGGQLIVYLNCVPVFTQPITGTPNFNAFYLGRWSGGNTVPPQEWLGAADELSLWSTPLTQAEICACQNCPLSGNESGLQAYWTFNEGNAGGSNTALTQVTDFSPNGNNGTLSASFSLTGPASNFITSTAPITYPALHDIDFEIRDYPSRNNLVSDICSGDPAHFCLTQSGAAPGPFNNVSVQWEYSDDAGASWLTLVSPPFTDFCFPVLPGVLTIPCSSSTDGFEDRKYRAVMTVTNTMTGDLCEYISPEQDLQICCPISPATVALNPSGPYCEGATETFTATLNSPDPFIQTPGPNVTLNWYYNDPIAGTRTLIGSGSSSVTHTVTFPQVPGVTDFCFEVDVTNCNGKMETFSACIPVDPEPECGTIDACPLGSPQNLMPFDLSNPAHLVYEICPGNDAIVCQDMQFNDCIPQWQYTFTDPVVATPSDWVNMGLSNTTQNTNILPSHLWPAGQTSIYYRIQCNPLSDPSGCEPCFSNIVEIRLKSAPAAPIIAGPTQVCLENTPVTLSISNVAAGLTYTWYHDGLSVGTGMSIVISESGCYWVEAFDGCFTVTSQQHCVEVCETIAKISCPLPPNECALPNQPVSLSACGSVNTCSGNTGSALQYQWSTGDTGCNISVIPAIGGSTYSVTVTDPATGCVGVASRTVVPCDAN